MIYLVVNIHRRCNGTIESITRTGRQRCLGPKSKRLLLLLVVVIVVRMVNGCHCYCNESFTVPSGATWRTLYFTTTIWIVIGSHVSFENFHNVIINIIRRYIRATKVKQSFDMSSIIANVEILPEVRTKLTLQLKSVFSLFTRRLELC